MGVSVGWVLKISLIILTIRLTFPQKWWIVKVPMTNDEFCQVHLSKENVLVLACRFELAAPSRGYEHFTTMQPSSVALSDLSNIWPCKQTKPYRNILGTQEQSIYLLSLNHLIIQDEDVSLEESPRHPTSSRPGYPLGWLRATPDPHRSSQLVMTLSDGVPARTWRNVNNVDLEREGVKRGNSQKSCCRSSQQ